MIRTLRPALFAALLMLPTGGAAHAWTSQELWRLWPEVRSVQTPAPCIRNADLLTELQALAQRFPNRLKIEEVGRSVQNRPIELMTFGHGPQNILLWSQMHGDEPSATPALLDIAGFLLGRPDDPAARSILDKYTLLMVPMLNPDGAEVYQRRNAQGIDINRDARRLATPEGRLLKRLRDQYEPFIGFNLHDQTRRKTVGDSGVIATNAVLAVSGDAAQTMTPGRRRAQRACSAIVEALHPFTPGGTARYDEDYNPRAFGDHITAWGTPVVLLESGGLPQGHPITDLTRLNFVALLRVLEDLARDDLMEHDPSIYENLPRNREDSWADVVLRGGYLMQPIAGGPYRADLAFDHLVSDREAAHCQAEARTHSRIVDVGDADLLSTADDVAARGSLTVPTFVAGVNGWRSRRWLTAENLESLARLGVGTIRWRVRNSRRVRAEEFARSVAADKRPHVLVVSKEQPPPWLVLSAPPGTPADDSLASDLRALVGTDRWRSVAGLPVGEILGRLWDGDNDAPGLRPGAPASVLRLGPADDGKLDLQTARILSVWIDGIQLSARGE